VSSINAVLVSEWRKRAFAQCDVVRVTILSIYRIKQWQLFTEGMLLFLGVCVLSFFEGSGESDARNRKRERR
jgi:hypothetical protein